MTEKLPQAVIITNEADDHLPLVQEHLDPECTVQIDPFTYTAMKGLTFRLTGTHFTTLYNGKSLEPVSGVWYRRPTPISDITLPSHIPEDERDYFAETIKNHGLSLLSRFRHEAAWMSSPYAISPASDKLLQLELAAGVGLRIAPTLLTANEDEITMFRRNVPRAVIKTQASRTPPKNGQPRMTVVREIPASFDHRGRELEPAILQEVILGDHVRLTVVHDQLFAAVVTHPGRDPDSPIHDSRTGQLDGTAKIEEYDGLRDIDKQRCITMVRECGLAFAAIDGIVDKRGRLWFLELNPNGNWKFVVQQTKQPIAQAIARFVMNPPDECKGLHYFWKY